jgi:Na+-transporting NADH:ubiquinone oxidoreductase subunit A
MNMAQEVIKLRKGYQLNILGQPNNKILENFKPATFSVRPTNFIGVKPIPKVVVNVGDEVKAGDPLFYDKPNPDVKYTAPVSGEVVSIDRGEKRSITGVTILADGKVTFKDFGKADAKSMSREDVTKRLLDSGLWPMLRQRPFNTLADHTRSPRDIFISGFDTSPLGPDYNFVLDGSKKAFQAGIDALSMLTDGKVHLSLNAKDKKTSETLTACEGVEVNYFSGKHPTGNVGVQIHHIAPINKGEIVWTVNPQDVVSIGRLFLDGQANMERLIAIGGPDIKDPGYYKTYLGAAIEPMASSQLDEGNYRYISGNVLTGEAIELSGHVGYFDHMVSVIEEGNEHEFLGWLIPTYARPSVSKTFLTGWLNAIGFNEEYRVNTNTNGERRAFVVTGQYEAVLPMDMYPVQLLKSIIYEDLDQMEKLGIYEVVEEDLAVCEFVCTSKTPVQKILREGMNTLIEQI